MTDKKITISRSFGRTVQQKEYEPANFFSARNLEIPADTPFKEQQEISKELFSLAMTDVMDSMSAYEGLKKGFSKGLSVSEFAKLRNALGSGETIDIEMYTELTAKATPEQQEVLNEFKKYSKRSK